jgi:hypothetical protein
LSKNAHFLREEPAYKEKECRNSHYPINPNAKAYRKAKNLQQR